MNINSIYPSNVIIKHNYIKVNNQYIASIIIQQLPQEIDMLELIKIIPKNIENTFTMYIKKMELTEQIKKLSKVILESRAEIKTVNNLVSKDLVMKINSEALELRRKLQIENEDVYSLNMYISIRDTNLDNLKLNIDKIISNLYANNVFSKMANFRHDIIYLNILPMNNLNEQLKNQTAINITTSQGAYLIPYIRNDIYDSNGILYGYINKSSCVYDIFSKNNMNHNMCVLGSSGAGKSYFVKTIILRNFCMNIRQIVFDIEEEYLNITNNTNTMDFNIFNFNMLYIPRIFTETHQNNFLEKKIDNVIKNLNILTNHKILDDEYEIRSEIKKLYEKCGITEDIMSMYECQEIGTFNINRTYKKYSSFPNIRQLVNVLENNSNISKSVVKLLKDVSMYKKYDEEKARKMDDKFDNIIIFNMKSIGINYFSICMSFAEEYYGQLLLLYIDEVWKFMSENSNENIAKKVAELYKTIRKKNAGIIIISQDIHDILRYENGTFGKSILNNSFTKLFFKMQYLDLAELKEVGICSKEILNGINKLLKGTACMAIGDISFNIDIKSSNFENEIIGGERVEKNLNSSR